MEDLELNVSTINDEILVNTCLRLGKGHVDHVEIRFNPFTTGSSTSTSPWSPRWIPNLITIHGLSLSFTLRDSTSSITPESQFQEASGAMQVGLKEADESQEVLTRSIILGTVLRRDIEEILTPEPSDDPELDNEANDEINDETNDDDDAAGGIDPQKNRVSHGQCALADESNHHGP